MVRYRVGERTLWWGKEEPRGGFCWNFCGKKFGKIK
jgi:hypothetical protein